MQTLQKRRAGTKSSWSGERLELGEEGLASRLGEEGVFESGAVHDEEVFEGEAHLQSGGIFFEESGVEHGGVVGGDGDGDALAKEFGKRMMCEFRMSGI